MFHGKPNEELTYSWNKENLNGLLSTIAVGRQFHLMLRTSSFTHVRQKKKQQPIVILLCYFQLLCRFHIAVTTTKKSHHQKTLNFLNFVFSNVLPLTKVYKTTFEHVVIP